MQQNESQINDESDSNLFTVNLNFHKWWCILPEIVALTCASLIPILILLIIFSRYSDLYNVIWADEIVRVIFLWLVFIGGAIAVKYDAHVRMALFSDLMERHGKIGIYLCEIIRLSPVFAGGVLVFLGIKLVQISMFRELPSLEISVGYFMLIIPISGILIIYYSISDFLKRHY